MDKCSMDQQYLPRKLRREVSAMDLVRSRIRSTEHALASDCPSVQITVAEPHLRRVCIHWAPLSAAELPHGIQIRPETFNNCK